VNISERSLLRLFDEHHRQLYRFAYRMTGSSADAEDIVQECFLALLQPQCGFDASRTPARTYLFGAVRNQALKRQRHRYASAEDAPEPVDPDSPELSAVRTESARSVEEAVLSLPANQREVLLLAHYEQLPLAEIAAALDIEIGAVKSRLQRARASLRECLSAYAPGVERA
jgi:RNA polymerase sigma factor (sigma-70 family)